MRCLIKIDTKGCYGEFPGVATAAGIRQEDAKQWEAFHKLIVGSPLICKFYSPLPFNSYHMTLFSLFTQMYDALHNWEEFINKRLSTFQQIHSLLTSNLFSPQLTFKTVAATDALQIEVTLPAEQQKLIMKLAKTFYFEANIPDCFHITLGYRYLLEPSEADKEHICELVSDAFNKIFEPSPIYLNSPVLCCFQSMAEFKLWDGVFYPFNQEEPEQENNAYASPVRFLCAQQEKARDSSNPEDPKIARQSVDCRIL